MPQYRLSATLAGHEDDVRTLVGPSDDIIVSGSRDTTVRVWYRKDSRSWSEPIINYKSTKFINSLALYNDGTQQLIASGGNDSLISLTSIDSTLDLNEPEYVLVGHSSNVCALDSKDGLLLSGSWDSLAKVWTKNGETLHNLVGHESSVWSVKFLSSDTFLTCGADRTIKRWSGNQQVASWVAHSDVVRDILILSKGKLASCSNDGTIKIWTLDGTLLNTLKGHESFIYSLALLPSGEIVSSGEDRTIRVWEPSGRCVQVITLPCISIWKVITLPNGDIVAGSSDSKVRVFSRVGSRVAAREELDQFETDLKNSSVSENVYDGLNKDQIPGKDILANPGKTEGQTQMVKTDINTVEVYQWGSNTWTKIGDVVSSAGSDKKKEYQGKSYDYIFDVDVEDGQPPLKLPYNVNESPYDAADRFLVNNNLPASYLQQIVDFILSNTGGVNINQEQGAPASSEPYQDPSYQIAKKTNTILPQREYCVFGKIDEAQLITGFKKLNSKQSDGVKLDPHDFETAVNCQDFKNQAQLAGKIIDEWDSDSKLIGFDILRYTILKIQPFENLFDLIKIGLTSSSSKVVMMTIRLLLNIFNAKPWGETIFADVDVIHVVFVDDLLSRIPSEKLLPVTVSSLILNYAVLILKTKNSQLYGPIVAVVNKFGPELLGNEESAYRLLIAIGTLQQFKARSSIDREIIKKIKDKYHSTRLEAVYREL